MADLILTPSEIANLLKVVYGKVLPNAINTETGPLHSKLARVTTNIVGGEKVVKYVPYGLMGSAGAFADGGSLPETAKRGSVLFTSYLKNQAARAKINEKTIAISASDRQAFEGALSQMMEALKESGSFDYGRQVYTDGTGNLTLCGVTSNSVTVNVASTQFLVEGMKVDFITVSTGVAISNGTKRKIESVISDTQILIDGSTGITTTDAVCVTNQGAWGNELTGVAAVMGQSGSIYGNARSTYPKLKAKARTSIGEIDDTAIMTAILERKTSVNADIDLLVANPAVYLAYGAFLSATKQHVNTGTLEGGWDNILVGGKPLSYDRFVPAGTLYGFDTRYWMEHLLHDWKFFGDQLREVPGTVDFETTMTKYSELICDKPGANFVMSGITVATY